MALDLGSLAHASKLGCIAFSSLLCGCASHRTAVDAGHVSAAVAGGVQAIVDDGGTLRWRDGTRVPFSLLASLAAQRNFVARVRSEAAAKRHVEVQRERLGDTASLRRRLYDDGLRSALRELEQAFPVEISSATFNGVSSDVIVPKAGPLPRNDDRVLINLHGGAAILGAGPGARMESIPVSAIGRVKVVTVNYRLAPEAHFPAASEDVAAVYAALLQKYPPHNIGVFGCSFGAILAGQAIATLQARGLPLPGAVVMWSGAPLKPIAGDSAYSVGARTADDDARGSADPPEFNYYLGANLASPLLDVVHNREALAAFPPTLLVTGTRDGALSNVAYMHRALLAAGRSADLRVWEGVGHCTYAQGLVDASVPENQEIWQATWKFFDDHLGFSTKAGAVGNAVTSSRSDPHRRDQL